MTVHCLHHDDIIKWKHFPHYWPFVRGIHWSPVNSPHKGQWRGALMFSLICARINGWVNNGEAGDLRCHWTHFDLIVMPMILTIHYRVIKNVLESKQTLSITKSFTHNQCFIMITIIVTAVGLVPTAINASVMTNLFIPWWTFPVLEAQRLKNIPHADNGKGLQTHAIACLMMPWWYSAQVISSYHMLYMR